MSHADFCVCGEAVDGEDVVEQARHLRPNLIVMDITMPKLNGLEATRKIRTSLPEIEVLVLSQHDSPEMMRQALQAGARGYVVKSAISADLVAGIETIRKGEVFFGSELSIAGQTDEDPENVQPHSHAEEDLRNLLAGVMDSSDDAIISHDVNGTVMRWNKASERLFWYTADEVIGQTIMLIVPPDRQPEEAEIIARIRRGERIDHFETVRVRKDGKLFDASMTISPVKDAAGRVVGVLTVSRDISEPKRREHALSRTESQLAAETLALAKLNDCSSRLWHTQRLEDGLQEMLAAIIELLGADKGIVRLLIRGSDKLKIVAHYGFEADSLQPFHDVTSGDATASGRALRSGKPVVIPDLESDEQYAPFREAARSAGLRAIVAAPLVGANGRPLGVLAAHFPTAHQPTDQEMRRLDLYVRQAADFLQRSRTEETLRQSEDRLKALSESLDAEVRTRTKELEQRNNDILKQSEQLRELSWQLLRTEDEERRRIARELHDSAGQTLAVLDMNVSKIMRAARPRAPEIAESIAETLQIVKQLTKEIRTASYLLHPPLLDETGLPATLSWYVRGVTRRSGLDIALQIPEDFGRLSSDLELLIFRIVQECLTNVHRHSESRSASIRITREPGKILLEVRDRGKGIPADRMAELQSSGAGVGIRGMRERLRQFHGEMIIDSNSSGTAVIVSIPVSRIPAQARSAGSF